MPRRAGRRTDYEWLNMGDVESDIDLGVGAGKFGTAGLTFLAAGTITRMRGKVGVSLNTGGAGESAMILCGLVMTQADVSGTAPEIFTFDSDDDSWIWQGALYVNSGDEAAVTTDFLSDSIEIDTKAMRRFKPGQSLALVHQSPAELIVDQAGTYDLTYFVHVLIGR